MIFFLKSIPLWAWLDIGFTLIVLVGVAGESDKIASFLARFAFKKDARLGFAMLTEWRARKIKHVGEAFVIIGIAGELACLALIDENGPDMHAKIKKLTKQWADRYGNGGGIFNNSFGNVRNPTNPTLLTNAIPIGNNLLW